MHKKLRPWLLMLACLILLLGGLWLHSWHKHLFTPGHWRREPEQRQYMLEDLQAKHELLGLSREAVVALLGEPDFPGTPGVEYTFKITKTPYPADSTLVYYLGPDPVWHLDSQWLILPLAEGRVADINIDLN